MTLPALSEVAFLALAALTLGCGAPRAATARDVSVAPRSLAVARDISASATVALNVGRAEPFGVAGGSPADLTWRSSDPSVAPVLANGFVLALRPGAATIMAYRRGQVAAQTVVTVVEPVASLVDPAQLTQFADARRFEVNGVKCVGSELNSQRASGPDERLLTDSNRIINPTPVDPERRLEWEVQDGTEVYDGAGTLMGTVAPTTETAGGRRVPTSKFNFGMSKVMGGSLCLYAFSVTIRPTVEVQRLAGDQLSPDGTVQTSAWLRLDRVVAKEALLERAGVGKVRLPRLPLESRGFRITGGDPRRYMTPFGELRIVKGPHAPPVPSHYLRRPSGTVNVVYSVPGYGLGGQGLDSFLVSDGVVFFPARGARTFVQPTYFPKGHARSGESSDMTMTFVYGAAVVGGMEPVYGWVAKEALEGG